MPVLHYDEEAIFAFLRTTFGQEVLRSEEALVRHLCQAVGTKPRSPTLFGLWESVSSRLSDFARVLDFNPEQLCAVLLSAAYQGVLPQLWNRFEARATPEIFQRVSAEGKRVMLQLVENFTEIVLAIAREAHDRLAQEQHANESAKEDRSRADARWAGVVRELEERIVQLQARHEQDLKLKILTATLKAEVENKQIVEKLVEETQSSLDIIRTLDDQNCKSTKRIEGYPVSESHIYRDLKALQEKMNRLRADREKICKSIFFFESINAELLKEKNELAKNLMEKINLTVTMDNDLKDLQQKNFSMKKLIETGSPADISTASLMPPVMQLSCLCVLFLQELTLLHLIFEQITS